MRGLKGCTEGQSGPVKIILKDGKTPDETRRAWEEAIELLSRQQEQSEQEYTQGCPF